MKSQAHMAARAALSSMVRPLVKRPVGITVLSVLLAWLAVAGFGNALVWNLDTVQDLVNKTPSSEPAPPLGGLAFTAITLAYGAAAAIASIALWHMHKAAQIAYAAWCLVVLLTGVWWALIGAQSEMLLGLAFSVGSAAIAALGIPYVRSKLKSGRPDTSLERTPGR